MKMFWALIGVLALATVALFASGALNGRPPAPTRATTPPASSPQAGSQPVSQATEAAKAPAPAEDKPVLPRPLPIVEKAPSVASPVTPAPAPGESTTALSPPEPKQDQTTTAAASPVIVPEPTTDAPKEKDPKPSTDSPATPQSPAVPIDTSDDSPLLKIKKAIEAERAAEAAAKAQAAAAPQPADAPPPVPDESTKLFGDAKAEVKADGSILVDGKYIVKGRGTKQEPYKITWDHLISAQNDYAPKEGRKTIPPRIAALNDKYVDITGYVSFPLMSTESDELLSMMNQWDGCCIGIPPTPYDAIEVRLTSAVSGNERLTTYGNISGKFKVDAHLVGGWLVGLYVMDNAKLTPVSYGGIAP